MSSLSLCRTPPTPSIVLIYRKGEKLKLKLLEVGLESQSEVVLLSTLTGSQRVLIIPCGTKGSLPAFLQAAQTTADFLWKEQLKLELWVNASSSR